MASGLERENRQFKDLVMRLKEFQRDATRK